MNDFMRKLGDDIAWIMFWICAATVIVSITYFVFQYNIKYNEIWTQMSAKNYEQCMIESLDTRNGDVYIDKDMVWVKNCSDTIKTSGAKIQKYHDELNKYNLNVQKLKTLDDALDAATDVKDANERLDVIQSITDSINAIKMGNVKPSQGS